MAILDIILMSDTDTDPVMGIGSIVVPKDFNKRLLKAPNVPNTTIIPDFGFAVVVSMSPFTLVSENASMRWQTTININDFRAIGKVNDEVMAICNKRLSA